MQAEYRDAITNGIAIPPPLLRPARFGPFPSTKDGLKFLMVAAVGGGVATVAGALAWLPFLAGGFVLAVYRPEGSSLDERAAAWLRWKCQIPRENASTRRATEPDSLALKDRSGRWVAAVEADGIPVAFLPSVERRRLFDGWATLLRSIDGDAFLVIDSLPRLVGPVLPPRPLAPGNESRAELGYTEMLQLLLRRRRTRRVLIVLGARYGGRPGLDQLSTTIAAVSASLDSLEIPHRRLSAREIVRRCPGVGQAGGP